MAEVTIELNLLFLAAVLLVAFGVWLSHRLHLVMHWSDRRSKQPEFEHYVNQWDEFETAWDEALQPEPVPSPSSEIDSDTPRLTYRPCSTGRMTRH